MTAPVGGQSAATDSGQSTGIGTTEPATGAENGGQSTAIQATQTTNSGTDDGQSTVSRADFDRVRQQLAAADQRRAQVENELKQLRDKDLPEVQKLQRDLAEAQQANAALQQEVSDLRIANAFLIDNTHDWHNREAALKLLDRSKLTVDSEGKIMGMKDALTSLAKDHPYLLKPKAPEPQTQTTPPAPGTPPANGGIQPNQGGKQSREQMMQRFPALRQRLGGGQ